MQTRFFKKIAIVFLLVVSFILIFLGLMLLSKNLLLEKEPNSPSLNSSSANASNSPSPLACEQQLSKQTCEKIGQMMIVGFGGLKQDVNGNILWEDPNGLVFRENASIAKMIKDYHVGGVILFTSPFRNKKTKVYIRERNIQNPEQVKSLNNALQEYSKKIRKEQEFAEIPLLITIDQEGGMVDRMPYELGFPQKTLIYQAFGANEEKSLTDGEEKNKALSQTRTYANMMANELKNGEFNCNLIPCVDVNINPINPIIGGRGRSFSANPDIVIDQAKEFISAFHEKNIITALKHFPGHGSSLEDTHVGLVDVTQTYQKDKELTPYRDLIKNGYQDLIMTTHVINGQIDNTQCKAGAIDDPTTWCPGTMSQKTLKTLLREELGFKGVIVSDDMTMGAITNEYEIEIAFEKAINAGIDMFIIANNTQNDTEKVISTIAKLVKEGKVSEQEIDRAYNNIVALKRRRLNSTNIDITSEDESL